MPIDRNYPRLDGELKLVRARLAEVHDVRTEAHQPVAHTPAAEHTKLPTAQPQPVEVPRESAAPATPPPIPATTKVKLPDAQPQPAEVRPTTMPAAQAPAPVRSDSPVSLTRSAPRVAEHTPSLPAHAPAPAAPAPTLSTPAPSLPSPAPSDSAGIEFDHTNVPAVDYSRIVWRNGPMSR